jgi:DNA-binding NtrC family response regulator
LVGGPVDSEAGLRAGDARGNVRLPEDGIDLRDAVEQFENSLILQALERTGWNKNQAAAMLNLNRTTLVEKIKKRGWGSGTK